MKLPVREVRTSTSRGMHMTIIRDWEVERCTASNQDGR